MIKSTGDNVLLSIAVVSGGGYSVAGAGHLYPIHKFGLADLDDLSRLVEAYILHDKVIYFHDGTLFKFVNFPWWKERDFVAFKRYDQQQACEPLKPFIGKDSIVDFEDHARMLRALRHPETASRLLPSRSRTPNDWMLLGHETESDFIRAELAFSEKTHATYYPAPLGTTLCREWAVQYGISAATILQKFTKARSSEITAAVKLFKPHEVELSPPLLVAHAVASSQSLDGFLNVIKEMRFDNGIAQLRRLLNDLAEAEPRHQIRMAHQIEHELDRILGLRSRDTLTVTKVAQIVPEFLSYPLAGVVAAASKLMTVMDLLEKIKVRRRLNLLRKLHRCVPSVKNFYSDLPRIFGPLDFTEGQLRAWLADPRWLSGIRLRPINEEERTLQRLTRRVLKKLNQAIRNQRQASQDK